MAAAPSAAARRTERRDPRRSDRRVPPPVRDRRLSFTELLVLARGARAHHPRTWIQENADPRQPPPGSPLCMALVHESTRIHAAGDDDARAGDRRLDGD